MRRRYVRPTFSPVCAGRPLRSSYSDGLSFSGERVPSSSGWRPFFFCLHCFYCHVLTSSHDHPPVCGVVVVAPFRAEIRLQFPSAFVKPSCSTACAGLVGILFCSVVLFHSPNCISYTHTHIQLLKY